MAVEGFGWEKEKLFRDNFKTFFSYIYKFRFCIVVFLSYCFKAIFQFSNSYTLTIVKCEKGVEIVISRWKIKLFTFISVLSFIWDDKIFFSKRLITQYHIELMFKQFIYFSFALQDKNCLDHKMKFHIFFVFPLSLELLNNKEMNYFMRGCISNMNVSCISFLDYLKKREQRSENDEAKGNNRIH